MRPRQKLPASKPSAPAQIDAQYRLQIPGRACAWNMATATPVSASRRAHRQQGATAAERFGPTAQTSGVSARAAARCRHACAPTASPGRRASHDPRRRRGKGASDCNPADGDSQIQPGRSYSSPCTMLIAESGCWIDRAAGRAAAPSGQCMHCPRWLEQWPAIASAGTQLMQPHRSLSFTASRSQPLVHSLSFTASHSQPLIHRLSSRLSIHPPL
jgi:hypothetical protein